MKAFISEIFSAISSNLISGGAYYLIAKGVIVTAGITVFAWIIAAVIGAGVSYLMCYEKRFVSRLGRCLCFVFRAVPIPTGLWLLYFCIFKGGKLPGAIVAGLAIGLYGGGIISEMLSEAAKKRAETLSQELQVRMERVYFSIVLPQSFQDSLKGIKRVASLILVWSSVSGYIGVNDLTAVMYGIGQRTMYPFFSLFFSAILYMIAQLVIDGIFKLIEKRLSNQ